MKRLSFYAHPHVRKSGSHFGYAYTYESIRRELQKQTVKGERLQVDTAHPKSQIQICYGTPPGKFFDHQYKIHMVQWESTRIPDGWVPQLNYCDEVWTANHFGANAFANSGVDPNKVHVYEHGVDSQIWTPTKRGQGDVIRFLHIDSGSPRKRADIVKKAFHEAFGYSLDYELTLKYSYSHPSNRDWSDRKTLEEAGEWVAPNVRHINENLSLPDLVKLFHFHDVLVYPSEGEGFGLIPLQALATGMPTISTGRWCSYEDLFLGNVIDSHLAPAFTIESYDRPGDVVIPSLDSTVELITRVANDIEEQSNSFLAQVGSVVGRYDWDLLTRRHFDGLVSRVGEDAFNNNKRYLQ